MCLLCISQPVDGTKRPVYVTLRVPSNKQKKRVNQTNFLKKEMCLRGSVSVCIVCTLTLIEQHNINWQQVDKLKDLRLPYRR